MSCGSAYSSQLKPGDLGPPSFNEGGLFPASLNFNRPLSFRKLVSLEVFIS